MESIPQGKVCRKCGILKDCSEFPTSKQSSDGLFSYCSPCRKEYDLQRRARKGDELNAHAREWRAANRDQVLESERACYRRHREQRNAYSRERYRSNPERAKAESRASRRKNPALNRLQSKVWAAQNPEKASEITRRWRRQNPDRVRANKRNYRARRRAAQGVFTQQEWLSLCAYYGHRCLCCGKQKPLTADHIVPLVCGGSNDIGNIQPLCIECNSSKGARVIDYRSQQ